MIKPASKPGPLISLAIPGVDDEAKRYLEIARKTFADSTHFKVTGLNADDFVFSYQKEVIVGVRTSFFEVYTTKDFPVKDLDHVQEAIREIYLKTRFQVYYKLEFAENLNFCGLMQFPRRPGKD